MKRAMIGGFISLIGSIWMLAVIISANDYAVSGWTTPPGKLLTQIAEADLMVWFGIFAAAIILGILLMAVEYFKKKISSLLRRSFAAQAAFSHIPQ